MSDAANANDGGLTVNFASEQNVNSYRAMVKLLNECPIPSDEILANLNLFTNRSELSRTLFLTNLYQRIINVPGVVMEFGCRRGRNLALWITCRTIYEPFNISRKIIGFDTFAGFPSIDPNDGTSTMVGEGKLSVTPRYEAYLKDLLSVHERLSPQNHLTRFELIKGDVTETVSAYFDQYPETIVSLAYFDVDLYEPTKKCLELIQNRVTIGSVIGFDELNLAEYPGETIALREVLGFSRFRLQRDQMSGHRAYLVVE